MVLELKEQILLTSVRLSMVVIVWWELGLVYSCGFLFLGVDSNHTTRFFLCRI